MSRCVVLSRLVTAAVTQAPRRHLNCNRAAICRVTRRHAVQLYPCTVVMADGATFTARYREPRKIIKLPLDLSTLPDEQRNERLQRRKPRQKVVIEEEVDDVFDASQYKQFWKR